MKRLMQNFSKLNQYRYFDIDANRFGEVFDAAWKPVLKYNGTYVSINGKILAYYAYKGKIFFVVEDKIYEFTNLKIKFSRTRLASYLRLYNNDEMIFNERYKVAEYHDFDDPGFEDDWEDFGVNLKILFDDKKFQQSVLRWGDR